MMVGLVAAAGLFAPEAEGQEFGDFRGLWVSRYEYNEDSTSDIQAKIADAATLGITDVFWQVRAKGDAYYHSNYEPPAEAWQQHIDPLQVALDAAHSSGVKLHAWMNTTPIWKDSTQPSDASHSFHNTDPSFRVTDINGNVEQLVNGKSSFGGSYARVNHVLPEVQTHINNVVSDLATNYDIDGVHLDYIRWLGPSGGSSESFRPDWDYLPHDAYSHQLYFNDTGLDASDGSTYAKRDAYRNWVQGRITDLVASVSQTVDAAEVAEERSIKLSAAVWNNPTSAKKGYLQDYRTWLQQDLLDVAIPMVYLSNSTSHLMDGFLEDILSTPTQTDISIGLGTYLHDADGGGVDETISQLQQVYEAGADSATFFSHGSFFNSGSLGADRLDAVNTWYDALAEPLDPGGNLSPDAAVITSFDVAGDEGAFDRPPTYSGSNQGILGGTSEQTFAEDHLGGGSQILTIDGESSGWRLRHLAGSGSPGANNPEFAATGHVGFWLKTETPGLSVRLVVDDPSTGDQGLLKSVTADGEWRLYEWDLSDDTQWDGWVNGDGVITGPTLSIDSIMLYGAGDAVVYLDTVAHNPLGSLLVPFPTGDYNRDGVVDASDFAAWREQYGDAVTPGDGADGNSDGVVDAADYSVWRDALAAASPTAETTGIPTPGSLSLLAGLALLAVRRQR